MYPWSTTNIWDAINAERKAAWLEELADLESGHSDFYADMQSGQGVSYAVDIVDNGEDGDHEYSVSVSTFDSMDRLILAGGLFEASAETQDLLVDNFYNLDSVLVDLDSDLVATYNNIFSLDIYHRLAEAVLEFSSYRGSLTCDVTACETDSWTWSVGTSRYRLDDVADAIIAAEDIVTRWLDDLGPDVAKAAYDVLTDDEKEKVQEVLSELAVEIND